MISVKLIIVPLLLLLLVGFFALFYLSAEASYNFHHKLKQGRPLLFRIIGHNEKYLNDKAKWIKHMRMYVILMASLIGLMLFTVVFSLF